MAKLTREEVIKSITDGNKDFKGWDLGGLDFKNANLIEAKFSGADLSEAKLEGNKI